MLLIYYNEKYFEIENVYLDNNLLELKNVENEINILIIRKYY